MIQLALETRLSFLNQKFSPMVQTDLSQLNRECNTWKENLRNYRSELSGCRHKLQEAVNHSISKSALPQVEHYDNQFDIQLTNISHLKHAIKEHEKMASRENGQPEAHVQELIWSTHESLHDQYQNLETTLNDLKLEFNSFVSNIR
jgi:predicted  nucleic acid-binding Zn-ribbon protein